jgi:Fe(3+) dicitrate transport protein
MKISNTKLGYCHSMTTIKGFSILSLTVFFSSIAQNKIAGMITDGDGKN